MKTTGEFVIHSFRVKFKTNKPIIIVPVGDVHRFAPLHAEDKWHEFIDEWKDKDNVYFLGMGDYLDVISTSERMALSHSNLHDSTTQTFDNFIKDKCDQFVEEIGFMKDRLIGMLGGNHYYEFASGVTSDQYLCERMGCKYLGVKTLIDFRFIDDCGHHGHRIIINAHHGEGGGRTSGASINKLQRMAEGVEADIILQGHDHNKMADYITRLRLTNSQSNPKLDKRKILLARTGGFLKGYVDGEKSYIVDANLNPTDLGTIAIQIVPVNRRVDSNRTERKLEMKVII